MNVQLPTSPAFLRSTFPATRSRLAGEFTVQHARGEVEIFSAPANKKTETLREQLELALFAPTTSLPVNLSVEQSTVQPEPEYDRVSTVTPATEQHAQLSMVGQPLIEIREEVVSQHESSMSQPLILDSQVSSQVGTPVALNTAPVASATLQEPVRPSSQSKLSPLTRKILQGFLSLVVGVGVLVGVVLFAPQAYYSLFPEDTKVLETYEEGTAFGGSFSQGAQVADTAQGEDEQYLPPQDLTLPEGEWLVIPRIGVRTQLRPTEDPEEALQYGVWQVPDFGHPGDESSLPIILAAHRFGWKWWWQSDYWKYHSFYLLPDTEPGDQVEIIVDQRKWVYEIYSGAEGDEITDYDADLILYTCKFLNSPIRHFRYARLIDPTANTQASR